MFTQIRLIENKETGKYAVMVNEKSPYTAFDNEQSAKAAAFDEACKAYIEGKEISVEYVSI